MLPGIDAGFLQVIPGNFVSRGRTGRVQEVPDPIKFMTPLNLYKLMKTP